MEGEASIVFSLDSSSGATDLTGGGKYTVTVKTPKGDSSSSIAGTLAANMAMEAVSGGYYSLALNSLTIAVTGSITIPIPQLTWKVHNIPLCCKYESPKKWRVFMYASDDIRPNFG